MDLIFQIKRRNQSQKMIVVSNQFRSFLLRTFHLIDFINDKFTQMIFLEHPLQYFSTGTYIQEKSLLIFDSEKKFSEYLHLHYQYIKSNHFHIFCDIFSYQSLIHILSPIISVSHHHIVDDYNKINYEMVRKRVSG